VEDVLVLSVTVDRNLRFEKQVANAVSKAHQRAALITRCFICGEPRQLFRAFVVYIRPMLEYCSCVWNSCYIGDIKKLESVQKKFAKCLRGLRGLKYADRLCVLNAEALELRRLKADLVLIFRVILNYVDLDCPSVHITG
jgi:hypothetical protein